MLLGGYMELLKVQIKNWQTFSNRNYLMKIYRQEQEHIINIIIKNK